MWIIMLFIKSTNVWSITFLNHFVESLKSANICSLTILPGIYSLLEGKEKKSSIVPLPWKGCFSYFQNKINYLDTLPFPQPSKLTYLPLFVHRKEVVPSRANSQEFCIPFHSLLLLLIYWVILSSSSADFPFILLRRQCPGNFINVGMAWGMTKK